MYDLVPLPDAGRLVRLIEVRGMSSRWPGAVAVVAGDGDDVVRGTLVAGVLDDQLIALAPGRHDLRIADADALAGGLSCGGVADVFVHAAGDLPPLVRQRLADGQPVTLVTDLDGASPGATVVRDDDRIAVTSTRVVAEDGVTRLIAAYRPTTRLVIVGGGLLAEALKSVGAVLGWACTVSEDPALVADLGPADGVIVLSHDLAVAVPVMAAALHGDVGYLGALGSRGTQARRAEALAAAGRTDLRRVHGPAGLDLGSSTPEEIALAVCAEFLACVRGAGGGFLRDRGGVIHR